MRFRKFKEVVDIKRYCKDMDITDLDFIKSCCYKFLQGKWKRNDVLRMLVKFYDTSYLRMKMAVQTKDEALLDEVVTNIAEYIQGTLIKKELNLPPIKYRNHADGMTRKERVIGIQDPIHQIYDYVAINGMKEVLDKKIGMFQCASIKGKGQGFGKKHIERWVRTSKRQLYFVKGDIRKCFPTIDHDILKAQLKRDIKNDTLTWLLDELIDMFDQGLSIGSYLSQYLSNYYLSQAYHYISNDLYRHRKTKSGKRKRVRIFKHVLFYMDDFILIGHNKRNLREAMTQTVEFMKSELALEVKNWKVCKFSDTEPIDMMGFVFRTHSTIIRDRIFIKTRRKYIKVAKHLDNTGTIPLELAQSCISAYGWYKHTDSYDVIEKYNIVQLHEACRQTVSNNQRKEVF